MKSIGYSRYLRKNGYTGLSRAWKIKRSKIFLRQLFERTPTPKFITKLGKMRDDMPINGGRTFRMKRYGP